MSTKELAERYAEAWGARDVDRIVDLHEPDSTFRLAVDDAGSISGTEAIAAAFSALFEQWDDLQFERIKLHCGDNHWVLHSRTVATTQGGLQLPDGSPAPRGRPVEFESLDLVEVSASNRLVQSKLTFIDAVDLQRQLESTGAPS